MSCEQRCRETRHEIKKETEGEAEEVVEEEGAADRPRFIHQPPATISHLDPLSPVVSTHRSIALSVIYLSIYQAFYMLGLSIMYILSLNLIIIYSLSSLLSIY